MTVQIRWTEGAVAQLEAIADYVAVTSPVYAARLIDGLLTRIATTSQFPQIGRTVPEVGRDDTRELIVRPYRIIYRITNDAVHVLAVVHSRRDFDQFRDAVRETAAAAYAA